MASATSPHRHSAVEGRHPARALTPQDASVIRTIVYSISASKIHSDVYTSDRHSHCLLQRESYTMVRSCRLTVLPRKRFDRYKTAEVGTDP
jgi:hypothetical protein